MPKHLGRRLALGVLVIALLPATLVASAAARRSTGRETGAGMPMSGPAAPGMASFDRVVPAFMEKWRIPGGAVAVVKDGRLVLARGYGWADREAGRRVEPDSLFRIASLSKSITAAAVLELAEAGRLGLDDRVFQLLSDLQPPAGTWDHSMERQRLW
jgi:CubicO group peptidase (beta-lactamase class C family)